jgi:hypothetical protein
MGEIPPGENRFGRRRDIDEMIKDWVKSRFLSRFLRFQNSNNSFRFTGLDPFED